MTNTQRFAATELGILAATVPDAIVTPFADEILALCEKFGLSGQSGGSAPYTASAISQAIKSLLLQKSICPISGREEEWMIVDERLREGGLKEVLYQNIRCHGLFKNNDGKCWYLDAISWKGEVNNWSGGALLETSKGIFEQYGSRQYVKSFPFEPKTFYIDIVEKEVAKDDWEFYIKNKKQLDKVFKYYDKY